MKKLFVSIFILALMSSVGSCGKFEETGLGEVQAVRLGAGFRTEGGGVVEHVLWGGTDEVAGFTTEYNSELICYTPRTDVQRIDVVMNSMKNQQLKFDVGLDYMIMPDKGWILFSDFKSYDTEIRRKFREAALNILGGLNLNMDLDNLTEGVQVTANVDEEDSFEKRDVVAKRILEQFKTSFADAYPDYNQCFYFIGATANNVEFPGEVLKKMEEAVAQQYKTAELEIEKQVRAVENDIRSAKAKSTNEASKIEAGALTDDVIDFLSLDSMENLITNKAIDMTLIIPLDERGGISWFNVRRHIAIRNAEDAQNAKVLAVSAETDVKPEAETFSDPGQFTGKEVH